MYVTTEPPGEAGEGHVRGHENGVCVCMVCVSVCSMCGVVCVSVCSMCGVVCVRCTFASVLRSSAVLLASSLLRNMALEERKMFHIGRNWFGKSAGSPYSPAFGTLCQ